MADSSVVATRRDGTITITDGAGSPSSYAVSFEVGDFSAAEPKADRVVIRDRGAIVGLRKGDDPVITFSFSVHMRSLTDSTADNLMDRLYNRGFHGGSPLTATGGDGFEQFLQTVAFEVDTSAVGSGKTYTATYAKCLMEVSSLSESADGNTIEVSGECYGGVTYAQS
jgi:hypothetical protein